MRHEGATSTGDEQGKVYGSVHECQVIIYINLGSERIRTQTQLMNAKNNLTLFRLFTHSQVHEFLCFLYLDLSADFHPKKLSLLLKWTILHVLSIPCM